MRSAERLPIPGSLESASTNFVINSLTHGFKEMETGSIAIEVASHEDKISVGYSDNGAGIPEENLKKIYEPFFSTNRHGGGGGLGLNVVYNIVTVTLGGTIECVSEEGRGAAFHIDIPNPSDA